jgi:hypothetical protein
LALSALPSVFRRSLPVTSPAASLIRPSSRPWHPSGPPLRVGDRNCGLGPALPRQGAGKHRPTTGEPGYRHRQ